MISKPFDIGESRYYIFYIDWENDTVPATAEVQLGKMFSPKFGTYLDGLFGIGSDKPYDWGVGVGVRFSY